MADASATSSPQRDQDVVTYAAFNGLRNDIPPMRFASGDLELARNVDIDKSGMVARRDGRTKRITGAWHSLWADRADDTQALLAGGAVLYRLNADYSMTALRSALTVGARISYAKAAGRVFFCNQHENGIIENGSARSWGLPVPSISAAAGLGSMPAGDYQYTATYTRIDGQESGAGLARRITLTGNNSLVFTVPASTDLGVVGVTVYLTTPNGDTLYRALTGVPGVLLYAGTAAELSLPLETQFVSAPPVGHMATYYRGRLYVAVGDTIYPSEPFAYELFDLRNYIQLDDIVTLMAPMEDKEQDTDNARSSGLFLGTRRSQGVLAGAGPKDFQYVPKAAYGAISGALDYVDGSLFADDSAGMRELPLWLSAQGLCVGLPNMEIRNLTRTKYGFSAQGQGASLFMPGPNRYIAVSNF